MVDLAGTWRFTALEGAELDGAGRATPFLTFDGDGQVFGLAGVNRVRGTWRLDAQTLTFGPVVSTLMAGPPDAMTREQQVLRLLGEPVDGVGARRRHARAQRRPARRSSSGTRAQATSRPRRHVVPRAVEVIRGADAA